ncbi:MAG: hypothetical protein ACO20H_10435 [Bacteriovoracaceae bacterium]
MTGLIWLIQLVHYPSFHFISTENFKRFQEFHMRRISFIVIPVMLVEITTAIILFNNDSSFYLLLNLLLNTLTFASTYLLSVPIHNKLTQGKDINMIKKLIFTNWPRTVFWSLRSLLLILTIWV